MEKENGEVLCTGVLEGTGILEEKF